MGTVFEKQFLDLSGDGADTEAEVEAAQEINRGSLAQQMAASHRLQLFVKCGAKTGSPDITVTEIQGSTDGTNFYTIQDSMTMQFTDAGENAAVISGPVHSRTKYLRLQITATSLDGSNKFATIEAWVSGGLG